jgi:hypothetical protein
LTFELLERGFDRAVIVEASAGYTAAASSEAARRGRSKHVHFVSGDFLEVAGTVPAASVVALDRVVCCYPLYEELLNEAVRHAERGFAFSYPRDRSRKNENGRQADRRLDRRSPEIVRNASHAGRPNGALSRRVKRA